MKKMIPKLLVGLVIGLVCPFIIIYGIYIVNYGYYEWIDYITTSYKTGLLAKTLSLGAVLNLAVFMLYVNLRKEVYAKGVLLATVLLGGLIVYIKYLA